VETDATALELETGMAALELEIDTVASASDQVVSGIIEAGAVFS
jgi:O-acetylhomoserine/O-acetylserine sulfhydrylase-like pyridoxal-dependent enzyme